MKKVLRKLSAVAISGMLLFSAAPVMAAPAVGMGNPAGQSAQAVENVVGMGSALLKKDQTVEPVSNIVGMAKNGIEDGNKAAKEHAASILSQKTVNMQGAGMARSLR